MDDVFLTYDLMPSLNGVSSLLISSLNVIVHVISEIIMESLFLFYVRLLWINCADLCARTYTVTAALSHPFGTVLSSKL